MQVTSQYKNNHGIPKISGRIMPWILKLGGLFEHKIDHHPGEMQQISYQCQETTKWQPDFIWNIKYEILTRYFKCNKLLSASVQTNSLYDICWMHAYPDALTLSFVASCLHLITTWKIRCLYIKQCLHEHHIQSNSLWNNWITTYILFQYLLGA